VIVAEAPVAVELVELIERGDVVGAERALRMTRHVDALPRRELAEDLALDLRVLVLERADLGAHVERLLRGLRLQLGNALLELEQSLLALDDDVHRCTSAALGTSSAARPFVARCAPRP
jgi:hypothetical protein